MRVLEQYFAMSEAAKAKWLTLTSIERDAVEQSFLAILQDPSRVINYGVIGVTERFEQGFRSYKAMLVECDDLFFAWGAYEAKGNQVPLVFDIVMKGDVCLLAH